MNENTSQKTLFPKRIRIVALILALLLAGEVIFSGSVAVSFSSRDYADTEQELPAEYLEQNDPYLTAGTLSRMRSAVSLLGEPKNFDQFSLFASVAIADEDYAKAAEYLLKASEVYEGDDKGLSAVYTKIGCLKALVSDWNAAAAYFEKAVSLNESDSSCRLMLCEAFLNTGEYEKALDALEAYSELAELSAEEFDALIQLQLNLEKYDDALASCLKAEQSGSISACDIALYRAQAYYLSGDGDRCLEFAEKARSDGGDFVRATSLIALCCESAGDFKGSLDACIELIDSHHADLAVYQQAAQDAFLLSDYESCIRLSEEALKIFAENTDTLVFRKWLGISYFETGALADAETNLSALLEGGESMPELNYLLGICEMSSENFEEAIENFTAALESAELYDESLYNRALCFLMLEKTDEASLDLQQLIDRDTDPDILSRVSELLGVSVEELENARSQD